MEVPGMEGAKQSDTHMSSAAAFVEGGIQDACEDACSICLENFSDSDPSTLTNCRHEFHLQCILEWCQRSSQCPMCWQAISLHDATSQELFEAVEQERNIRVNPPRNATRFHHPTLGEFEVQLPVGVNDAELEERIIQHLTAAAAMGRAHQFARREGHRSRSSSLNRPQFLLFSPQSGAPNSASSSPIDGETEPAATAASSPSIPLASSRYELSHPILQFPSVRTERNPGSTGVPTTRRGFSLNERSSSGSSSLPNQDRAGPSDFQSFSESLKSRFNAASMRYKESISKSTRGWKERLFSRNTSMSSIGSEIRAEVNAGIASVSRMMEQLDTRNNNARVSEAAVSDSSADHVVANQNQNNSETRGDSPLHDNSNGAACARSSISG